MIRRRATIALHWGVVVLLLLHLAAGGQNTTLAWAFAVSGLAMVGLALVFGLMNGPGPKLDASLRRAYPFMQWGMYGLLAWCSVDALAGLRGVALPGPETRTLLISLLAASSLHGLFNLWRHTVLQDGALRRITPRVLHGML